MAPGAPRDDDGVDLDHYAFFQACFTGAGGVLDSECEHTDFDLDGDADRLDLARFQAVFNTDDQ